MKRILPLLLALCLLLTGCMPLVQPQAPKEEITQFTLVTDPVKPAEEPTQETAPEATPEETSTEQLPAETPPETPPQESVLPEDGHYTTKDDVAAYLAAYGHLPENFITKDEARKQGWEGGGLWDDCCIGGDRFGNREGALPKSKGRIYYECDIDTMGRKSRGAKRIVYSNDGLIYYTDDHYESFTLLYGEE